MLITVRTFTADRDTAATPDKIINHARPASRKWLNDHIAWASRMGYGVQVEPLPKP